ATGCWCRAVRVGWPGIERRPLRKRGGGLGAAGFCEVFFPAAPVPAANLIGPLHGGWAMAKETLANERVSLSREGLQWGHGPTVRDLVKLVKDRGGLSDPVRDPRLGGAYHHGGVMRVHQVRQVPPAGN